jgi:Cof subfamily protein (haloacid dehalogenase superfamily)
VIIVTGRMFRSALPYARAAGIEDPVVCYQGAAVVDPVSGEFLLHDPIPLEPARAAVDAIRERGFTLNAYVDDELYVAEITPEAHRYASFQNLPIHEVGDLRDWLEEPPTKLVTVGTSPEMDALKVEMKRAFDDVLHISKSLPIFLELSRKDVTKGSGIAFVADRLGFSLDHTIAFGDGQNDVELLQTAGFAVAVADADESLLEIADLVCPPAEEEGVAQVIEALLHRDGLSAGAAP